MKTLDEKFNLIDRFLCDLIRFIDNSAYDVSLFGPVSIG